MSTPPPPGPGADIRRHVVRLSGGFLLDLARLVAKAVDADVVSATIQLAINRANVRDLTAKGMEGALYAGIDEVPPDHLRRPVTVYAIAKELGVPYETVRRHVLKLVQDGVVVRDGSGVVIPQAVLQSPRLLQAAQSNWELTLGFLRDLAACGVRADEIERRVQGVDVRRQVLRLSIGAYLDSIAHLASTLRLDLAQTLLFLAIVQANVSHLTRQEDLHERHAALNTPPRDIERVSITVYAIARDLDLPYETARRHVVRMTSMGLLVRTDDGGVIAPTAQHERTDWIAAAAEDWEQVRRFVDDLARIGVTANTTP